MTTNTDSLPRVRIKGRINGTTEYSDWLTDPREIAAELKHFREGPWERPYITDEDNNRYNSLFELYTQQ